jgi:hypothetical protein
MCVDRFPRRIGVIADAALLDETMGAGYLTPLEHLDV